MAFAGSAVSIRSIVAVLLFIFAAAQSGAQEVIRQPTPDWVIELPIPEPKDARLGQVQDGIYYLLFDRQVRKSSADTMQIYRRIAKKVVERAGLEKAASLSFSFRPDNQKLFVHAVRIRRGTDVIDMSDRVEFLVVRRETELDRGILNGELTAHANLRDVRVGDVIEYEVTHEFRDLIAPGHITASFQPDYSVPLGRFHYRLTWPRGVPMGMRQRQTQIKPVVQEGPDTTVYTWTREDLDPLRDEDHTPIWHQSFGRVWMSSMTSWGEVVDDLLPHYDTARFTLPADFAAEVDRIGGESRNDAERVSRLLRLIQDKIRYVAISIGPGRFIPRPPDLVLNRGFGDCKDKSILLIMALRRLGIDAAPALAHLENGPVLADRLPSPYAFNHLIVHVRLDGDEMWLDPTDTHQGGIGKAVVQPDYGWALPLRPGSRLLRQMKPPVPSKPTMEVTERFDFGGGADGVEFRVTTVYTHDVADRMRRKLGRESTVGLGETYLEHYKRYYPGLVSEGPLTITDNRDNNRITVIERYRIPKAALADGELLKRFPMYGTTLVNVLRNPGRETRRTPVYQYYPLHYRHIVLFLRPPIRLEPPEIKSINGRWFQLDARQIRQAGGIGVDWRLRTSVRQIDAADAPAYSADVAKLENEVDWYYTLSRDNPETTEDAPQSIGNRLQRLFDGWRLGD